MASLLFSGLKQFPVAAARKALGKINPLFNSYFSKALTYGYSANQAMDYLNDRFSSSSNKDYENQLESSARNGSIRPDEDVNRTELNREKIPGKIARTAITAATGLSLGSDDGSSGSPPIQPDMEMAKKPESPLSMEAIGRDVEAQGPVSKNKSSKLIEAAQRTLRNNDEHDTYKKLKETEHYGKMIRKWEDENGGSF